MIKLIFYLFSLVLIFAAVRVVTVRNPIHAVLYLILAFFSCAAIWLLLQAEFLAITLVLVYVGAVMVLFLFVVMMLDIDLSELKEGFSSYVYTGTFVGIMIFIEMAVVIWGTGYFGNFVEPTVQADAVPNIILLARSLYIEYLYPFEIAAVILLVAMVAAMVLTIRTRKNVKHQKPEQQVVVKRSECVRLVKMASEKQ
jgi:NADH-quinone oxidoreductase subunit J